jgi:hypothetical protein
MDIFLVLVLVAFVSFFILQEIDKSAKLKLKKYELKDSISLIDQIIEIQEKTPQNPISVNSILDIDINSEKVELMEPTSRSELALKAVGTLHLHHDQFLFLSSTQTTTIKLSNIIKTDLFTDALRFNLKNRQKTVTFAQLDTPTALYHLSILFNKMNEKYSTSQWDDSEYFTLELISILDKLNTQLLKL